MTSRDENGIRDLPSLVKGQMIEATIKVQGEGTLKSFSRNIGRENLLIFYKEANKPLSEEDRSSARFFVDPAISWSDDDDYKVANDLFKQLTVNAHDERGIALIQVFPGNFTKS